jgi:bis(5'-nucleosyl)-tetraphosphatase (symmetrical)
VAIYAIGDVQGCFDELEALVRLIQFQRASDQLWFVGDLVNRGPKSLQVLRFVSDLGGDARVVLGNHDLNLVAIAAGARELRPKDTVQEVLDAADGNDLVDWLAKQPLLLREPGVPYAMVHAGLAPQWDVAEALIHAREVQAALTSADRTKFLTHMYGDKPDRWKKKLAGWERLRFITNALTRIRYVGPDGRLNLAENASPGRQPGSLTPWYESKSRRSYGEPIVFGHWATLQLEQNLDPAHRVYHLDTGCVWGGKLTALRLDDERYFSVPSQSGETKERTTRAPDPRN